MPPPQLQDGRPTLTTSQRRAQIDESRFIDIRNLAYLSYKRPDGAPLLKYEDTLDNRETTKQLVLSHEIAQGWLIPDGTEGQIQQATQPAAQPEVQGAPTMQPPPFQPPNGAPPPNGQAPVQQTMPFSPPQQGYAPPPQGYAPPPQAAPQMMPPQAPGFPPQAPQSYAPPPQQQMQPPPQQYAAPPPVASPQQAAAVGAPPQQEQPAAAPTGRKRRGQGAAVAPPPAAPPPVAGPPPAQQQTFAPQAPQGYAPQAAPGFGPPQGGPPPQFAPAPPQMMAPPQAAPPMAQQGAPSVQLDIGPIIQRIDAVGQGLQANAGDIKALKLLSEQILVCLHHLYSSSPVLGPTVQNKKTLPEFKEHLKQFIGVPQ